MFCFSSLTVKRYNARHLALYPLCIIRKNKYRRIDFYFLITILDKETAAVDVVVAVIVGVVVYISDVVHCCRRRSATSMAATLTQAA